MRGIKQNEPSPAMLEAIARVIDERLALHAAAVLDVAGVTRTFPFSERAIYAMVSRRTIPHRRIGSRILFSREELEKWFSSLPGINSAEAKKNA